MTTENKKPNENIHVRRYYVNGAHAGNISFHVSAWGKDSAKREEEIIGCLDELIKRLSNG